MKPILEINNVRKNYAGFSLADISFQLERGYIMGFIGPNGSGKTTTIKLIMNLLRRDGGKIKVFGLDNVRDEVQVKEKIGFVYDENYFYDEVTVEEMKRIIAPFYTHWDENTFRKLCGEFGLPFKSKIKTLSKGTKMKFSLALALSHQAELLLMDEPTAGLDPVFRRELLEILQDTIQDGRRSILFSTHVTSDLEKVADYITFINQGKIVLSKSKEEMFDQYAVVKGENGRLDSQLRKELIGLKEGSYGFEGLSSQAASIRSRWKDQLLIERPTLEDIMLFTVRGEQNA